MNPCLRGSDNASMTLVSALDTEIEKSVSCSYPCLPAFTIAKKLSHVTPYGKEVL